MHGYCLAMAKEYRASGFQAATRGPLSSSQEGGGKRRAINSRDASAEGTNADNFGNAHMQHPNTLEGINRRLVCPLAVTYPDRFPDCHKSGGFKNTSRVKEHLYRCHLVSQCTRCGQIYDGDQESHGQMPPHFAINQRQKDQLQKRGGLRGMDEGQRWNKIYRVVYPYADSPYPSPYLDSHSAVANPQETADFPMQAMSPSISRNVNSSNSMSPPLHQMLTHDILNNTVDDHQLRPPIYSVSGSHQEKEQSYVRDSADSVTPSPTTNFNAISMDSSSDPYHELQFNSPDPVIWQEYFPGGPDVIEYEDTEGSIWIDPTLESGPSLHETSNPDPGYGTYTADPHNGSNLPDAGDFFNY